MRKGKERQETLRNKGLMATRGERLIEYLIKNRVFFVEVLLCALILFFHAKNAGHYANYYPINGTFQNYNPVRRLISGQIPYRDFQDYLGLGHLYLGSIFTLLFGGTYRSSLMAFSFLTIGSFATISFVLAKAIFGKKEWAIAMTNILIVLIVIQPFLNSIGLVMPDEIKSVLDYVLKGGNSARFVRGLIIPVSIVFFAIVKRLNEERYDAKANNIFSIVAGVVGGFSFIWSNDFGISCWLCIFLMTFWYRFTGYRTLSDSLKAAGIELVSSIAAIFLLVEILTVGHFANWLQSTFWTGGYQRWYYNSAKTYYLWEVDFSCIVIVQSVLCIYYLIRMLSQQEKLEREKFTCLAYANMVGVCAVQEYKVLSGGESHEVAYSILFVTVLYESISLIISVVRKMDNNYVVTVVSMISGAALLFSSAYNELVFDFATNHKEGIFIAEMGGNLTSHSKDLVDTDLFLGEDRFFSTYASAQEVVSGQFQPSGTDYIIHVLGDKQRAAYKKAFQNDDFRYVATIKEDYTDWEYWVQRANWFLYREIYKKWHPVYSNTYEVYWERNDDAEQHSLENGFTINVFPLDDSSARIAIQCECSVNGIADVFIDYEVKSRGNMSSYFNIQKLLKAKNTGTVYSRRPSLYESNYLRDKSAEYIPIPITNGYGEVTLTSNPKKSTYLKLNNYSCDCIYTVTSDFVEVSEVINNNTLCIPISEKVQNSVSNVSGVLYDGKHYQIEYIVQDEKMLYIKTSDNIKVSVHNIVELVR